MKGTYSYRGRLPGTNQGFGILSDCLFNASLLSGVPVVSCYHVLIRKGSAELLLAFFLVHTLPQDPEPLLMLHH